MIRIKFFELCFRSLAATEPGFVFTLETVPDGGERMYKAVLKERSGSEVEETFYFKTKSEASSFFFGVCIEEGADSSSSWDDDKATWATWLDSNWLTPAQFHSTYE